MGKLIHLTDTHLVTPGRRLYALDPQDRLRAAVDAINKRHGDAEAVFITGDLTHWGEAAAYQALKEACRRLLPPCHLALGNHDLRGPFHQCFPAVPSDDAGYVQYAVPLSGATALVLDTLVDGSAAGALCPDRLDWLERQLAALPNRDIFVFLHHAPFDLGIPGMDLIRLNEGAERLGELLASHGRVRHLFYGHVHRPIAGSWRGIPCSTVPATAHQVMLQFTEPVEVSGSHEPPALGVVLWSAESVVVHTESYLDDSARFALDDKDAEAAQDLAALPLLD